MVKVRALSSPSNVAGFSAGGRLADRRGVMVDPRMSSRSEWIETLSSSSGGCGGGSGGARVVVAGGVAGGVVGLLRSLVVLRFLEGNLDLVGSTRPRRFLLGMVVSFSRSSCSCLRFILVERSPGGGRPRCSGFAWVVAASVVLFGGSLERWVGWKNGRMFSGLLTA